MDITHVKAIFGSLRTTRAPALYSTDHDLILQLIGIRGLPEFFHAYFSNSSYGTALDRLGQNGQVSIPNSLIANGLPIYCRVVVESGVSGRVVYSAVIPVRQSARPSGEVPAEQADIISQAITALNAAGESAQEAATNAAVSAEEAAQSASEALNAKADIDATLDRVDKLEQQAGTAGWMAFEIVDGELFYERTPSVQVDFNLVDGDLVMEAINE